MKLQSNMKCDPRLSVRSFAYVAESHIMSTFQRYRVCSGLCSTDWNSLSFISYFDYIWFDYY